MEIGINTWKYGEDDEVQIRSGKRIQKSSFCWFQSGIFCARSGLTNEAQDYLVKKMLNKSQRFSAFWDTGNFDQCPDFDHGGAGMINLQEMLLQTDGKEIRILPSWPEEWNVDFKLHAPYNTVIKGHFKEGNMVDLEVTPGFRSDDIVKNK